MNTYTVSFFGHRQISQPFLVEERLEKIVSELIKTKEYVEFLVGRNGEFDIMAASVIRRTAKKLDYGNSALVLVLSYMTAEYRDSRQSFHEYYDEVEICAESAKAHFKAAIRTRNKSMVDRSDLVVCCVERSGGAHQTMRYAKQQEKLIMNIAAHTAPIDI